MDSTLARLDQERMEYSFKHAKTFFKASNHMGSGNGTESQSSVQLGTGMIRSYDNKEDEYSGSKDRNTLERQRKFDSKNKSDEAEFIAHFERRKRLHKQKYDDQQLGTSMPQHCPCTVVPCCSQCLALGCVFCSTLLSGVGIEGNTTNGFMQIKNQWTQHWLD